MSQPGRRRVLKPCLSFPAIPVTLVKDNLTSLYRISHLFLCPIIATLISTSGCDFSLFTVYLITEGLLKGLNTQSDHSKVEQRSAGLNVTVVKAANFYKGGCKPFV